MTFKQTKKLVALTGKQAHGVADLCKFIIGGLQNSFLRYYMVQGQLSGLNYSRQHTMISYSLIPLVRTSLISMAQSRRL